MPIGHKIYSSELKDLVAALEEAFEVGGGDAVSEALETRRPRRSALLPHESFSRERYERRPLYRDSEFELLLLCWEKGQATSIHDHDGQSGWFTVLEGALAVQEFERRGGPGDLREITSGRPLPEGSISLELSRSFDLNEGDTLCETAGPETVHRVGAPRGRTVSLHVYSKPLDALVVFDPERGTCRRVTL
jgi:quercetin dioxygenase-like cupin family protein